jgi:tRNA pseudouridine55 synthase
MTTSPDLEGILPVDKPVGPTSHDVVARARRALGLRRIGHTGTLDPFASGLLLLCLGRATRIAEYLTALPKSYAAVMRFGQATDTDDHTGRVIAESEGWRDLDEGRVREALERRVGRQLQVPPAFSARKQQGVRLYELARRGEAVAAAATPVEIYELRLTHWEAPLASFETTSSSGTYIRAIARDTGDDLGVPAHLVELRRTTIGGWRVGDAVTLDELAPERARASLTTPLAALRHLPRIDLEDGSLAAVRHGRAVPCELPDAPVATLAHDGALVAIAEVSGGLARPRKVLLDG